MRMIRPGLAFAAALIAAGLAGCGDSTGPEGELAAAQAQWARQGPTSYSVTVALSCECGELGPVVVTVRKGIVESRRLARDGSTLPPEYAESFPAVPGLFVLVQAARREGAARLHVQYHPTYGYPTRISIDWNAQMIDDEITYTASNLLPE